MTPDAIVMELVMLVARLLPGFLALFSGSATDAEALTKARTAVRALRKSPAATAIGEYQERHERADEPTRPTPVDPSDSRRGNGG